MLSAENIFYWLHHLSTEAEEDDGKGKNKEPNWTKTRILNLNGQMMSNTVAEIIEHCKQARRMGCQSESPMAKKVF